MRGRQGARPGIDFVCSFLTSCGQGALAPWALASRWLIFTPSSIFNQ